MIQAAEPMKYQNPDGNVVMQVNTTFKKGNKTLSLSCDNSVGRLQSLSRSDIRLFQDGNDVTSSVFSVGENTVVPATLESMQRAMNWLNRVRWGFNS